MKRSRALAIGLGVGALVLIGTLSDDSTGDEPTPEATGAEAVASTPDRASAQQNEVVADRCLTVSPEKVADIESGLLRVRGGGTSGPATLRGARAIVVDSPWVFISAEIDGPGLEGDGHIGTWIVSDIEPRSGLVYAADGPTEELSQWGAIRTTRMGGIEDAPESSVSRECVRDAQ